MPQNDSHDALIFLNIHNWGEKSFQKKFAHQLRLPSAKVRPGGQVRGQIVVVFFTYFFILHKILTILSLDFALHSCVMSVPGADSELHSVRASKQNQGRRSGE